MTYELGQQVLVRGVVADVTPDWVHIEVRDPRRQRGRGKCFVAPADVVGPAPATPEGKRSGGDIQPMPNPYPAPATPDEGEIARLRSKLATTESVLTSAQSDLVFADKQVMELGRKLAAAEARIAAAERALSYASGYREQELAKVVRRALSVETTGTESGGGHE